MLAHPATYWAKYLLSTRQYEYQQVVEVMESRDLAGVTVEQLTRLDEQLARPKQWFPTLSTHAPSANFLREEGIYELWHPDKESRDAEAVLYQPKTRKLVETLLLSPFRPEAAVERLNKILPENRRLTLRAYLLFQHYFWCSEHMTGDDWGTFVLQRRANSQAWISMALHATSPESTKLLLWKMGLGTLKNMDSYSIFKSVRDKAALAVAQLPDEPSLENSRMLANYTKVLHYAQDGMEHTGAASESLAEAFKTFSLEYDDVEIPAVHAVTYGRLSVPDIGQDEGDAADFYSDRQSLLLAPEDDDAN